MTLYSTIQRSLFKAISHPQFNAALPPLSDATWSRLLEPSNRAVDENERLEFMGDALMYATIGRQLYAQIPDGTPHLYTSVRNALHSNATFSYLAEKLDILAVSSYVLKALTVRTFGEGTCAPLKTRPQVKATADLFETVIGAYYLEVGFEVLCDWVREIYTPLIKVAERAFLQWQAFRKKRLRSRVISGRVTKRAGLRSPKKATLRSALLAREQTFTDVTPRSNVLRDNNFNASGSGSGMTLRSSVHGTTTQVRPQALPSATTKASAQAVSGPPTQVGAQALPAKPTAVPVLIDLTLESDDSDDDDDDDIVILEPTAASTPDEQLRVAVPWSRKSSVVAMMRPAAYGEDEDDSSGEDEVMRELTTDFFSGVGVESDDMADCNAGANTTLALAASGSQTQQDTGQPSSQYGYQLNPISLP